MDKQDLRYQLEKSCELFEKTDQKVTDVNKPESEEKAIIESGSHWYRIVALAQTLEQWSDIAPENIILKAVDLIKIHSTADYCALCWYYGNKECEVCGLDCAEDTSPYHKFKISINQTFVEHKDIIKCAKEMLAWCISRMDKYKKGANNAES